MKRFVIEVAVGFTDGTWESTITEVEDFSDIDSESVALDKVLEDFSNHPNKVVSFLTVLHVTEIE